MPFAKIFAIIVDVVIVVVQKIYESKTNKEDKKS